MNHDHITRHAECTLATQLQRCHRMNLELGHEYAAEAVVLEEMARTLTYEHPAWRALVHGASAMRDDAKDFFKEATSFYVMYVEALNREAHQLDRDLRAVA